MGGKDSLRRGEVQHLAPPLLPVRAGGGERRQPLHAPLASAGLGAQLQGRLLLQARHLARGGVRGGEG